MKSKSLDFLVIGAHKSGTTALFQYLRRHPQIFMPPEKEVSFFSNEEWFAKGWQPFAQEFFKQAPTDALWGKVTPQYMAYPHVPERIAVNVPRVKLIALLRNPIDRAFSHYRMALRLNHETRTFDEIVTHRVATSSSTDFFSLGEYGRILAKFLKYFPTDQLLVVFTEDLEHQPQQLLDSILAYLGLRTGYTPENLRKKYHEGGTRQRFPWLISAVKGAWPFWWVWRALPEKRRRVIRFWFNTQVNAAPEPPPLMDIDLRRQLIEFYRTDVARLENLIRTKVPWAEFHN